jgi:hypothetical protein
MILPENSCWTTLISTISQIRWSKDPSISYTAMKERKEEIESGVK